MSRLEATRAGIGRALAGTWVVGIACSPVGSPPPEEGDCVSTRPATCSVDHAGGVEPSGGDAGGDATQCAVNSSQSQCDQCAFGSCCDLVSACFSTVTCANLYNCTEACVGVAPCVSSCDTLYPGAVIALQDIESCVTVNCPVCAELGVGDPCGGASSCVLGLSCGASWCTKTCQTTSDCGGLGPNGGNRSTGLPNACVATSEGFLCVPGCTVDADCTLYPGTFCEATTSADGTPVSICASLPDAGEGA
jgi:hypothetical protein